MRNKEPERKNFRKTGLACILACLLLVIIFLAACEAAPGFKSTPETRYTQAVDPLFKEYYQALGGMKVLGPVISKLESRADGLKCQFTESALMCYNPMARYADRISLYPLGKSLGLKADIPLNGPVPQADARVVDGYVVYAKFVELFDKLYGERTTGTPLTNLRTNLEARRVEQFFENIGFAQSLDDPNGPVFLIPYGAYFCGQDCSYRLEEYWSIIKSSLVEEPLAPYITRAGGVNTFGEPLLQPRVDENGDVEQLYSNGLFYRPHDNPNIVLMRPLPSMLGIMPTGLVEAKPHKNLVFRKVRDGLGHNVPLVFDHFIAMHGGYELSGQPITEVVQIKGTGLLRQCFENYCLVYDVAASEQLQVRILSLGEEYIKKFAPSPDEMIPNIFTPDHIFIMAAADKPRLALNEEQTIRMVVLVKDSGDPLERVEASMVLSFSDGSTERYFFRSTDASGMSSFAIPAHPRLKHGERVGYQVCLNLPSDSPICSKGSYLIWNVK